MAVSENGSQIWNPGDLMVGERAIFKDAKFVKVGPIDLENILYAQETQPSQHSQITKLILEGQAGKPKEFQMEEKEAAKLVTAHKAKYKYDTEVELEMAKLGYKTKPEPGEDAYDYLTRLYDTVKANKASAIAMMQEKLSAMAKAYEAKQMQQQMQNQHVASTQANPYQQWGYSYSTQAWPNDPVMVPAGGAVAVPPKVEPEPEKPKKDLPDPIEPKKRLMSKK